jgi:hypothetical protein
MVGEDVLLTTAEVGVAFAGFASVVTVFQRREAEDWATPDVVRFRLMITASLSVVVFALLPFAFQFFGAGEEAVWAASSSALGLYAASLLATIAPRSLRLARAGALSRGVAWAFAAGAVATVVLQVLNAAGLGLHREVGPYFLGLLYLLALSGVSFARLLPIGRAKPR